MDDYVQEMIARAKSDDQSVGKDKTRLMFMASGRMCEVEGKVKDGWTFYVLNGAWRGTYYPATGKLLVKGDKPGQEINAGMIFMLDRNKLDKSDRMAWYV